MENVAINYLTKAKASLTFDIQCKQILKCECILFLLERIMMLICTHLLHSSIDMCYNITRT